MGGLIELKFVVGAMVFSAIGIAILVLAFYIMDRLTPFCLGKELTENKNIALAIVIGSALLGLSNIIASAIH
ncbi:MAG TPA: DUF350 domain-containing protein [Oligoflexia bacterium]|nr:DUF350 domain-containing protein [Oligoflexia bacterium]HMP49305.1 DUF350 domain-containing protein [Oligoflexia bacterium]